MDIHIRLAEENELNKARDLVTSIYMSYGYLTEDKSDFDAKINYYSPTTVTLVAVKDQHFIGSLSLVIDSHLKLPIDALYSEEVDQFRDSGRKLCELSQFAVSEGGMKTSLLLCKYAKVIAYDILHMTDFTVTVNPKHRTFYLKVLKFSVMADEKVHPNLSSASAAPFRLDLLTSEEVYQKVSGRSRYLNLHDFFYGDDIEELTKELIPQIPPHLLSDRREYA